MGKLLATLRRLPTRTSAFGAIIVASIVVPAALLAWGPDRPTYTIESPADHITFNSITNNPNIGGDERDFVGIREKGTSNAWSNDVTVQRDKEYIVRAYVHNNASSNLNLVAENVRAKFSLPTTTGKKVQVQGTISADNATPKSVWDEANFNSTEDFNLAYIPNSAKFSNNVFGDAGANLSTDLFTSAGAQLGYTKLDGKIPGCFQYDGYVYFTVKPQFAPKNEFDTKKQVRTTGTTEWKKDVAINAGDTVDYMLTYKNTGETRQNNVLMQDTLPAGMEYVPGSTTLHNGTNPNGIKVSDNVTKPSGINIGDYLPNAVAYVKFSAKAVTNDKLPVCGPNKLTNKVRTTVDGGYKEDTADVTVPKECQPPVAKYTCDALTVTKISNTQYKFQTGYTVENATLKNITYVVRSENGTELYRGTNADYTQTTPGKYSVQAYVTVTVNGEDKTVTSDNCKKHFEVPTPPPAKIEVCDLTTKQIITINESDFDASKHSKDLKDCAETPVPEKIEVCDLTTKTIITINKDQFDSTKHSMNTADCKEAPIVHKIEVCDLTTKAIVMIDENKFDSSKYSMNKADCAEMPTELPQTGVSGGAMIAGAGVFTALAAYALTNRRIRNLLIG